MDSDTRPTMRPWMWVASGIAVVAVVCVLVLLLSGDDHTDDTTDDAVATASDACIGVAEHSIDLDSQITGAPSQVCFEVEETSLVTVGAAALDPEQIIFLSVSDASGDVLGLDESTPDWDPQVAITLEPGAYRIEVTGEASDPPPFLLYTSAMPPPLDDESLTSLPAQESCGDTVPWLDSSAEVEVSSASPYVCIDSAQESFVAVGARASADDAAREVDLVLSVYALDDGPALLRTGDDAFGADPQVTVDLSPGVYLVEVSAWFDEPFSAAQVYLHGEGDAPRMGNVTAIHADLDADACAEVDLRSGDTVTVEGERTYHCLHVEQTERVTVEAATLTDQDLVLEIIGIVDGEPRRLAWADDDPYVDVLGHMDPLIDTVVPAGRWVIAVTPYYDGVAADYDLRVTASEPR